MYEKNIDGRTLITRSKIRLNAFCTNYYFSTLSVMPLVHTILPVRPPKIKRTHGFVPYLIANWLFPLKTPGL